MDCTQFITIFTGYIHSSFFLQWTIYLFSRGKCFRRKYGIILYSLTTGIIGMFLSLGSFYSYKTLFFYGIPVGTEKLFAPTVRNSRGTLLGQMACDRGISRSVGNDG